MRPVLAIVSAVLVLLSCEGAVAQEATTPESSPIALTGNDEKILNRIRSVFSAIEGLDDVEASVESGVVALDGTVPDMAAKEQAADLARRVEGVVTVLDDLEADTEIASQLSPVMKKVRELGGSLVRRIPLIILALLTFLVFWWLSNMLYRRESLFGRLRLSGLASDLVRRLVRLLVIAIGFVIALEIVDATAIVGAVLGAAGLAGLAIGFAFKSIIENYLAGVLLSTRNPFEIRDEIEINGHLGKVARLTARDTVLVTLDGNHLRIPNGVVINSELLNFTRNPKRRFEFEVGVSVDLDLSFVRRTGLEAMRGNPAVLADPRPVVLVDTLGDSTVILKFQAWIDQEEHDFWKTRSETIRLVKTAFDAAEIEMPEPIYRVNLRESAPPSESSPSATGEKKETVELPVPGTATIEEDLSADHTIDEQIEEDAARSGERNLLPGGSELSESHES